jgi:hypothetical protein
MDERLRTLQAGVTRSCKGASTMTSLPPNDPPPLRSHDPAGRTTARRGQAVIIAVLIAIAIAVVLVLLL